MFEAKRPCDASVFSPSELEALRETVDLYGPKTAGQLIDLTHREATWLFANQGRPQGGRTPIFYELFFLRVRLRNLNVFWRSWWQNSLVKQFLWRAMLIMQRSVKSLARMISRQTKFPNRTFGPTDR